VFDDT